MFSHVDQHEGPGSIGTLIGTVKDGRSTSFWTDRWINGQAIKDLAPALMTFSSGDVDGGHARYTTRCMRTPGRTT